MVTEAWRHYNRRRTAAQFTAENPVLAAAEFGVESDTGFFKVGNGTAAWNTLGYADGASLPDLATSDPAKVPISTTGGITTLDVTKTVPEFARLTADTAPVNNSTTLVNATGLSVPVAANAFYAIDGYIAYTCTTTASDFKIAWTTPAGVTGNWTTLGAGTAIGTSVEETTPNVGARGWGLNFLIGGNDFNLGACLRGNLATAGTAGTLQLQFAQATAVAANAIIRAGSWIRAERLA
jgi:Major tropism determinant N-terminal domain